MVATTLIAAKGRPEGQNVAKEIKIGRDLTASEAYDLLVADSSAPARITHDDQEKGVFDLPKVSTDVLAFGSAVYWDNTAKLMTSTTTSNTKCGVAVKAAVNPSGSVNVRLNGTF